MDPLSERLDHPTRLGHRQRADYHTNTMSEKSGETNSSEVVGQLQERLVSLEMLVMHLQHDHETLGKVLLDQQKEIDLLRGQLDKLGVRVEQALIEPEVRDPHLEKPPHY